MKTTRILTVSLFVGLFIATSFAAKSKTKEASVDTSTLLIPAVVDGNPALQFSENGWSTYVSVIEFKGQTAFKFPLRHYHGGDGFLYVTSTRVVWDPEFGTDKKDQGFEVTRESVVHKEGYGWACDLRIDGKTKSFAALFQRDQERDRSPKGIKGETVGGVNGAIAAWCNLSLNNSADAERGFHAWVGDTIWGNLPEVKRQRQALENAIAAWRASGSKVDPPEEAQRHFVLAQEAYQEKNVERQTQELEAALEIYPTWPAEQSDLALILGELGHYSEAIEHMQMYLDLAPNAPDAQHAKQQIWIWQDKVAHQQPPQQTSVASAPPARGHKAAFPK